MKKLRIINTLLGILLFIGCTVARKDSKYREVNWIPILIEDYKSEFSEFDKNESLNSIIIRKNSNSEIIIKDIPLSAAMGYIKENKVHNYKAGMFSEILCLYYIDELNSSAKIFMDLPLELKNKAKEESKIIIGSKEILVSNEFIEWHPTLEIIYSLERKEKTVKNLSDDTERNIKFNQH